MRDVTLVILNSLRIKCHISRPLININIKNHAGLQMAYSDRYLTDTNYT